MLWWSNERMTLKYTLAKESETIPSAAYMGKVSVCFEGFRSIMIQNWMM